MIEPCLVQIECISKIKGDDPKFKKCTLYISKKKG